MTYDSGLAHRIRGVLQPQSDFEEREMFGGIGFMLDGNMCCGVIGDKLVARVAPDAYEDALEKPHTSEFDFTGRPMRGWVFVDQAALATQDDLEVWLDRCLAFARTLSED